MEPGLRVQRGSWVAERDGVQVQAVCGQEALLRLNLELVRRDLAERQPGRLIVEEAPFPQSA